MESKEFILALIIMLLFYCLTKRNNILTITPSTDKMSNVEYHTDDINDIHNHIHNHN